MDSGRVTALAAGGVFVVVFLLALLVMSWPQRTTEASFAARGEADAYVESGGKSGGIPGFGARPLRPTIHKTFAEVVAETDHPSQPPKAPSGELGPLESRPDQIKVARFEAHGMTYLCMVKGRAGDREMAVTRYNATQWQYDDGGETLFRATGCAKAMIDHGAVTDFEAFEDERRRAVPNTPEYASLRSMFEAAKAIRARQNAER